MQNKEIIAQLSSLAQEARLDIFRLLVRAGAEGLAAGMIGEKLDLPASTLSFHLKELSRAGMIEARPISRFIYYVANYTTMRQLIAYLTENCCVDSATECLPMMASGSNDCCDATLPPLTEN